MEKNHANSWHSKALAVDQHVQVCFYWREKCNMAPKFMCVFWGQSKGISALLHCYHVWHMLFNISLKSLESRLSEALRM